MPPSLEAQYKCLADLKEIDERLHYVERDVQRVPDEIREKDAAIVRRRSALDSAKALFAEAEKKLRAAERDLKEKEDALFKAEGKLMEVKTNVEYAAAAKENQAQKEGKGVLEDKVLQLITSLEEQKKALVGIEADFKVGEKEILAERDKLAGELEKLKKTLQELTEQRLTLAGQLDAPVATMYHKIVAAKKGVAVAIAEGGRCLACNIQVRAQIFNEILGRKAVHRCGSCGKILITPPRPQTAPDSAHDHP